MSTSAPFATPTLSTAIAARLRTRILQGEWSAGAELHDSAIATQLGVSRTPVREALQLLCHEGLLTAQPRRGVRIACLPAQQVQEAQALHTLLQSFVLQHASPADGVAAHMLQLVQQRLQLAALASP